MPSAARSVIIREVGLRDGLQSISRVLLTAQKIEWIREAHAAGQREIEVGSFVPARLLPQLADTEPLVAYAKTLPGLCLSVLVPNLKGAERAIECGANVMLLPLSASHAHSLANLRKTPDEVVQEIARIRATRDAAASKCLIEVGISTRQDFDRLIALRAKVAQWLPGEALRGSLWRTGLPKTMLATAV